MNNVREILEELGYRINSTSSSYRCRPLYRDSDNNTSLSINKITGNFIDFPRNISGTFEELIRLTLKFDHLNKAKIWLENKNYKLDDSEQKPILKMNKIFDESEIRYFFPIYDYWNKRGISNEILKLFGGGVAMKGKMLRRYVFPIRNDEGDIIGFSGRSIANNSVKWLHNGKTSIRTYPYYINRQYIEETKEIILTESIGNCLALWEAGFKNALVMFGVRISDAMISLLIKVNPNRIIIATDNDGAGNSAANEIYNKLSKFFDINKLQIGTPLDKNDLLAILEDNGVEGIKKWYRGLEI